MRDFNYKTQAISIIYIKNKIDLEVIEIYVFCQIQQIQIILDFSRSISLLKKQFTLLQVRHQLNFSIQFEFSQLEVLTEMFGGGFPFGGFSNAHMNDSDDEGGDANTTQYYQILEINKNASQDDIKKAYLRLAKLHHPDKKGGDSEKFKKIGEAYETLKDPEKRKMYDKYGKDGPKMGGGDDLLNMFFGGGRGGRPGAKQVQKVQATKKGLEVTLQNIYNGDLLKIPHKRTRCCEKCGGKGGQNVEKCKGCKGQGRVVQMYQMGPGMYQQVQKNCDKCQGQGEIIGQGGKCKTCNGKKILEKQKIIQVPVEKGTPNNYPIKIVGEGNQIPDALAGDLIFITQEKEHKTFVRKGADLFIKKNITLVEALCGFQFKLKHLNNVEYTIYTGKGQVLADDMKKVVRGLGLPFHKDPMSSGNLIIQFHIVMPKRNQLSKEQIEALVALLPGKPAKKPTGEYEMFQELDLENLNTNEEGGKKPEDEYDEEAEHQGISCGTH